MICNKCQNTIPDGSEFCSFCGAPAPVDTGETEQKDSVNAEGNTPESGKKGNKNILKVVPFVIAAVVVAILAVVLSSQKAAAKEERYQAAVKLGDAGCYKEAKQAFLDMGDYEDAPQRADLMEMYNKYEEGMSLLATGEPGDAEKALKIFDGLGSFEGSQDAADKCGEIVAYQTAGILFQSGNYQEAGDKFTALGDYLNSKELAQSAYGQVELASARSDYENGDFESAENHFKKAQSYGAGDFATEIGLCENEKKYAEACDELGKGNNYTAYTTFLSLMEFKDSIQKASGCVLENPKTGEYYRDPSVEAKGASLTIPNKSGSGLVYKIIAADGKVVSCAFVNDGERVKVKFPAGTYSMKEALGTKWFGETDLFGDEGVYIDRGSFTFKNAPYILKSGGSGHALGTSQTDRGGF